jgi:hypothetical protein
VNSQNVLQDVFKAAGWSPGPEAKGLAQRWILETVTTVNPADGKGWELFPAAESALGAFCGLTSPPLRRAGEEVAPRGFAVDPRAARHALGTFRAFGARIDCGVFPFGSTDGCGKLAVDERGRLFCVDHGGWWFLGESVDEGLGALAEGRAPRRVRDDGTWAQALEGPWSWAAPPVRDIDAVTDVVRTTMVLVAVLHRHGVLSTTAVHFPALNQTFRLRGGSLEDNGRLMAAEVGQDLAASGGVASLLLTHSHSPFTCEVTRSAEGMFSVTLRCETGATAVTVPGLATALTEVEHFVSGRGYA